ncbi:MAG: glycoside hydrolase family 43 protein [Pseudoxanthomonas sp.]
MHTITSTAQQAIACSPSSARRTAGGRIAVGRMMSGAPTLRWLLCILLAAGSDAACAQTPVTTEPAAVAVFDWFEYVGHDAAFEAKVPAGSFRNPVLAGFHADPSVVAANGKFYLVNSSFTYFPGIPVFESDDLVHWRQIGHVIHRPSQLDFDGLSVSRGVFAPAISFHDGTFYVVTTAVDNGGNFIATATNPAGPWSDPIWLKSIGGIDPSLFFDDDGQVYLVNNDAPRGTPRYEGHRAIWMQQIDLAARTPVGPRRVLVDGGVTPAEQPIWIEGPHLYKRQGWYYLSAAEGGTGPQHSQVVLRSRQIWGPYRPDPGNPILTQRDLPPGRPQPITNAGHADLVQGPDDSWWAVFLASRNYARVHYNTGRETYLLPVTWKDGWPRILDRGKIIPYVLPAPSFMRGNADQAPSTGNFNWRDDFDDPVPGHAWVYVRVPKTSWVDLTAQPGHLTIHPLAQGLDTLGNPAFLARRQQHLAFVASTSLALPQAGTAAGIAAFQNEHFWYFLGVRRTAAGAEVFLEKRGGKAPATVVASRRLQPAGATVSLKIQADGGAYAFGYDDGHAPQWLVQQQDGTLLSTEVAGGFVGAMIGPYARDERPR